MLRGDKGRERKMKEKMARIALVKMSSKSSQN